MPSFNVNLPTTSTLLKTIGAITMVSLLSACNSTPQVETTSKGDSPDNSTDIHNIPAGHQLPSKDTASSSHKQGSHIVSSQKAGRINDLWSRIRAGYQFHHQYIPHASQQRIDGYIARYSRHPKNIFRQTERASTYLYYVVDQLQQHNLPTELALLPFVESSYDPFAYSSGHASGLWQFIPGTGARFKLNKNWWIDERRDVVESTEAAIKYLKYLYQYFDNDWLLAIAAYNAGEGTVSRAIRRHRQQGKPTDYWSLPLPKETVNYLPKLFAWSEIVLNPDSYQLRLAHINNRPYFSSVNIGSQIDLAKVATMVNISIDNLYALNPAFNRWATDPEAPHNVLIPVDKVETLQAALATHPINERVQWQHYTIQLNDSLSTIAARFNTTVAVLKSVNQLKSNRIRTGKSLVIPSQMQLESHYNQRLQQRVAKRQKSAATDNKYRIEHVVTHGETLWGIARRYNVSTRNIAHWNNISEQGVLHQAQRLVVWAKKPSSTTSTTTHRSKANKNLRELTYKVRSGDSLSTIAHRFNISVNKIQRWNKVNPKAYIQPGQTLTLFVSSIKP